MASTQEKKADDFADMHKFDGMKRLPTFRGILSGKDEESKRYKYLGAVSLAAGIAFIAYSLLNINQICTCGLLGLALVVAGLVGIVVSGNPLRRALDDPTVKEFVQFKNPARFFAMFEEELSQARINGIASNPIITKNFIVFKPTESHPIPIPGSRIDWVYARRIKTNVAVVVTVRTEWEVIVNTFSDNKYVAYVAGEAEANDLIQRIASIAPCAIYGYDLRFETNVANVSEYRRARNERNTIVKGRQEEYFKQNPLNDV